MNNQQVVINWSVSSSMQSDPYKRDSWYETDAEWEAHIVTLPPKKVINDFPEPMKEVPAPMKEVPAPPKPEDTVRGDRDEKRSNAFQNIQKNKTLIKKSKMCRRIVDGKKCPYKYCHFAHKPSELNPAECAFGDTCKYRNSTCAFIHARETHHEFTDRMGYTTNGK